MSRRTYSSGSGGGGGDQKRRTFTKLMRDKNASVSSIHQASRFLEGMETFNSKAELLAQLQDPRNMGMHRIREVLSFVNSIRDVITLLIPLLGHIMTAETSRPIYRPLRDKLLLAIYNVPGLMLALEAHGVACDLDTESATCLCSFLRSLTKAILEPRQSELVLTMARNLRERGDVDEAGVLCTFLLVDGVDRAEMNARPIVSSKLNAAACWVTDMVPPGGRHDNDHRNFRNIRILPTIDELTCTVKPYLPLASGENRFMDEPVSSLLDSNFRLLREDAVSTMKQTLSDDSARGTWTNARIVDLDVGNRGGGWLVSFVVQCDSRTEGNPTWKYSRALRHGAVVALCRNGVPVRMGTIVVREAEEPDKWLHSPMGPKIGVAFESLDFDACIEEMINNSGINAIVCDTTDDLLHTRRTDPRHAVLLGHLQIYDGQMTTYDLIEVSKSFFAYHPILKALQAKESIPLSNELLGSQKSKNVKPSYLPDNISLPNDPNFEGYECDLEMWSTDDVVQKTTLDKSQADALRHSLSSRVALIQGPPGTGKTFLGALVARTIRRNTDETILCVCYTNHALDQFLEHMLATGENRLVRIGGRSKSETLGGYNLRNLSRRNQDTEGFCQRRIKQVTAQLFDLKKYIESDIELLKAPVQWSQIRDFLLSDEPETFDFLQAPNMEDGFNIIGPNGKVIEDSFLWDCWRKGDPLPSWTMPHLDVVDIREFNRFWNLSLEDRAIRIQRWKGEIMGPTAFEIAAFVEQFNALAQEMQSLRQDGELEILMSARVIGATTSGAANYRDLLALTAPGVVIVEEAGEVLEAHILTSLSESTQNSEASKHLIMIGDHKQLPPKVEQHALSTASGGGYNLDCSLFERLIVAGLPSVTLEVQHRMRPSISALIRAQTYPSLVDHDSVRRYPDLQGVSKNVVFVDHQQPEDGADTEESRTKSNQFEAELSLEIVRYFMLQGYRADQIVVLTPYVGQLVKLISLMKTNLKEVTAFVSERDAADLEQIEGADQVDLDNTGSRPAKCVRCSSIDNFQGEEADIIVISLVRSNSRGDIGFLKEKQRVNVLLSRARLGLFLVGNSSTLMNKMAGRHVWGPILQSFTSDGCLLKGLPSTCQLHPDDEPVQLCNAREFRAIRPNGGCDRSCNFRLPCGHACPLFCHPTDRCHERAQKSCCEPCKRFPVDCPLQHPCLKLCKDECGPCCAAVGSTQLLCGHSLEDVKCYETGKENAMFHLLLRCKAPKMHTFQSCGHDCETTCVNSRRDKPHCPAKCGKPANCEHPCTNM